MNFVLKYFTAKNKRASLSAIIFILSALGTFAQPGNSVQKDIIEIRIYHFSSVQQENQVDNFLEKAYLPALQRTGIKPVGVLKPIEGDTLYGKRIFVIIPYTSLEQFEKISEGLENDKNYLEDGKSYLNASYDNPPFERIEKVLLSSFDGMPKMIKTDLSNSPGRIFELRSYEAATENLLINKVKMFNEGEIQIFERLDFNAVFYGAVIAGSHMPNLMYMTSFENKESRDAHWKSFGNDAAWKEMSAMEEYQNNVSNIDITMLKPTHYSGL